MKKAYLTETMTKLSLMLIISVLAVSCAQNKRDRVTGVTASGIRPGVDANGNPTGTCTNGVGTGVVYDNGQLPGGFYATVQNFVSGWMDPSKLGQIDGSQNSTTTGIDLGGSFTFNGNNLVQSSSSLSLKIFDQFAASGQYAPLELKFDSSNFNSSPTCLKTLTGTKNGTQVTIVAKDCIGTITVTGTNNGQKLLGYVQFANYKYYQNASYPRSGTLGQLSLPSCAVH